MYRKKKLNMKPSQKLVRSNIAYFDQPFNGGYRCLHRAEALTLSSLKSKLAI